MSQESAGWRTKHILLFGSDEFRVKERTAEVLKEVAPEDPLNMEVVDGQVQLVDEAVATVERVRGALLTLPFFGGRKVVHFKSVTFLGDTKEGRSEVVLEALDRLLETLKKVPVAEVQLVVSAVNFDRRRTFARQLEAMAHVERFDLIDLRARGGEDAVMGEIERALRAMGLTAEPSAVERLMNLVGSETRTLYGEIEKLAVYVHPERLVTEAAVREVVAATRDLVVWDLCDAVAEGKEQEALGLLRQLLAQGENEIGLLAILAGHFRLMAVCWALEKGGEMRLAPGGSAGVTMSEKAKELLPRNKAGELPKPFRLARALTQGRRRSRDSVFGALETLYRSYWAALSGGADRTRALESGVVALCRLG